MLDIRLLREETEAVRTNLGRRNDPGTIALLDEFLRLDRRWRDLKGRSDELRSRRNRVSQAINEAKKSGKDATELLSEAKAIPHELAELEKHLKTVEEERRITHLKIPNLLDDAVPVGKDDTENKSIKTWGEAQQPPFALKPHGEIAEGLGSDFDRATKIAGAGFYFLRGDVALLNQALIQFAIQHLVHKGYLYTEPPLMMRRDAYEGVISLADFASVQYKTEDEDLYLIATSEHPLVAQYMGETLDRAQFPIRLVGYSMCFRKEIGSRGVDTKGLFRTHQFNKVEQVVICKPSESETMHQELLRNTEELMQALGLAYRVVDVCTGDMGIVASRKYDIEAWMPRSGEYKEVASCSNCTDYQSRRLGVSYQDEHGGTTLCHTLNNTAIATSRVLVAILENYQQEDGSVVVPKVLVPFMMGKTVLRS